MPTRLMDKSDETALLIALRAAQGAATSSGAAHYAYACPTCSWRFNVHCPTCHKQGVKCPRCGRPAQKATP
jgi:predicted RNA-binding Zn-ribbon protein involved in translation (DUF1610 family)